MVDGVKGFPSVQEEKKLLLVVLQTIVKLVGEIVNMIPPVPPRDKPLLLRTQEPLKAGGNGGGDRLGQNPIYSIGDGNRTGVASEHGILFGDENELPLVKPLRRLPPFGQEY